MLPHDFLVERRWLVNRVIEWHSGTSPLLILTGDPGCGKSTFLASLANASRIEPNSTATTVMSSVGFEIDAMYFCSRRVAGCSINPRDFTRSLSQQFSRKDELFATAVASQAGRLSLKMDVRVSAGSIAGSVNALNVERLVAAGLSDYEAFAAAVRDPLDEMLRTNLGSTTLALVDGVDEALGANRISILDLVIDLAGLPGNCRLIVSTKNDDSILARLAHAFPDAVQINMSASENSQLAFDDILQFATVRSRALSHGVAEAPLPQRIAETVSGNFLLADGIFEDIAAGQAYDSSLKRIPAAVEELYTEILSRTIGTAADWHRDWSNASGPLLGMLAASREPVPRHTLSRWLNVAVGDLALRLSNLGQLVLYDAVADAYALRHLAIASFLRRDRLASGQTNVFHLDLASAEKQIFDHYSTLSIIEWGHYGLLHSLDHASSVLESAATSAEHADRVAEWISLRIAEMELTSELREAFGEGPEAARPVRDALSFLLSAGYTQEAEDAVEALLVRGVGLEQALAFEQVSLHATLDPDRAALLLRRVVSSNVPPAVDIALRAACLLPPKSATDFFEWAATQTDPDLRQAASYAIYLAWVGSPSELARVLSGLSKRISVRHPLRTRNLLDFLASATITNYICNPQDATIAESTSSLWHAILVDRLHVKSVHHAAIEKRLVRPVLARRFARRIADGAVMSELQDPAKIFGMRSSDRLMIRNATRLLEPSADLLGSVNLLSNLFDSEIVLLRLLGGMVLATHAYLRPAEEMLWTDEMFASASGRSRTWQILALTVILPDTPVYWLEHLERRLETLLDQNLDSVVSFDDGALAKLDLLFVPLALAYAKADQEMTFFESSLDSDAYPAAVLERMVLSVGVAGLFYPEPALRFTRNIAGRAPLALVASLALMYSLRPALVDAYMAEEATAALAVAVHAQAIGSRPGLWMDRLGLYNNGVHQAARYPLMRRGLLMPIFRAVSDATDVRGLLDAISPEALSMLKHADYRLIKWLEPEEAVDD